MTASRNKKMMGGFMCQSPGSTAIVCMTVDPRSVIVPRRTADGSNIKYSSASSSSSSAINDHARLINNSSSSGISKYSRLVDSGSCSSFNMITLGHDQNVNKRSSSSSSRAHHHHQPQPIHPSSFQVVVMRVSIHCQGCAGKVKKHLSKMEGVTSFSIDLETKRVTVMGHVSPVGVLESISKVKKAEFWSSSSC
ncbi:Heavy metal-associated domain [Macleaya cordata]|uniref:Heavy metal-associated domain n=1 Tax=Macleaya cordata TaxID=56857 RepID=A0A200QVZ4_MACCD|nr:Heavy metal-associated domain [Macleaya cordata]